MPSPPVLCSHKCGARVPCRRHRFQTAFSSPACMPLVARLPTPSLLSQSYLFFFRVLFFSFLFSNWLDLWFIYRHRRKLQHPVYFFSSTLISSAVVCSSFHSFNPMFVFSSCLPSFLLSTRSRACAVWITQPLWTTLHRSAVEWIWTDWNSFPSTTQINIEVLPGLAGFSALSPWQAVGKTF